MRIIPLLTALAALCASSHGRHVFRLQRNAPSSLSPFYSVPLVGSQDQQVIQQQQQQQLDLQQQQQQLNLQQEQQHQQQQHQGLQQQQQVSSQSQDQLNVDGQDQQLFVVTQEAQQQTSLSQQDHYQHNLASNAVSADFGHIDQNEDNVVVANGILMTFKQDLGGQTNLDTNSGFSNENVEIQTGSNSFVPSVQVTDDNYDSTDSQAQFLDFELQTIEAPVEVDTVEANRETLLGLALDGSAQSLTTLDDVTTDLSQIEDGTLSEYDDENSVNHVVQDLTQILAENTDEESLNTEQEGELEIRLESSLSNAEQVPSSNDFQTDLVDSSQNFGGNVVVQSAGNDESHAQQTDIVIPEITFDLDTVETEEISHDFDSTRGEEAEISSSVTDDLVLNEAVEIESELPKESSPCASGLLKDVYGNCVEPEVSHRMFFYAAPEVQRRNQKQVAAPKPKLEYNIVVVRNPTSSDYVKPLVVPPPQRKTLVYVLNKRKESEAEQLVEVPTHPRLEPDVFFVNYGEGENTQLAHGLDLQTALRMAAEGNVVDVRDASSDLSNVELTQNLAGSRLQFINESDQIDFEVPEDVYDAKEETKEAIDEQVTESINLANTSGTRDDYEQHDANLTTELPYIGY